MSKHPCLDSASKNVLEIMKSSKADSSIKKYKLCFKKFSYWCQQFDVSWFPAQPSTLAVFLSHLVKNSVSTSILDSYFYAIKWFHNVALYEDSCSN